jgi:hypothetical protein
MEMLVFGGLMIWLALGGYAYAVLTSNLSQPDNGTALAGMILCVVLGPFMFGWAIAVQSRKLPINPERGGR